MLHTQMVTCFTSHAELNACVYSRVNNDDKRTSMEHRFRFEASKKDARLTHIHRFSGVH